VWPWWVVATAGGLAAESAVGAWARADAPAGTGVAVVAASFAAVPLGQWLVLRTRLPLRARSWIVATYAGRAFGGLLTALAALLAHALGVFPPFASPGGWTAPIAPVAVILSAWALGFAQWHVLRRVLPAAGTWIVANTGAGALIAALFVVPGVIDLDPVTGGVVSVGVGPATLAGLRDGLIEGAVTGAALVVLLRRRPAAAQAQR
jgi:hypothetical protein